MASATKKSDKPAAGEWRFTPENDRFDGRYEFGGTVGNLGLIAFSHVVIFYFWICIEFFKGEIIHPWHEGVQAYGAGVAATSGGAIPHFFVTLQSIMVNHAAPNQEAVIAFLGFLLFEYFCACTLPGVVSIGLPIPSENYTSRKYYCNGLLSWYAVLTVAATLHFTGIYPLYRIRENIGPLMSVGVIFADIASVVLFASGYVLGRCVRLSGNLLHDFFMGTMLNPRLPFDVDVKLFAEIRNSWVLLFLLTLSQAAKNYHDYGYVSTNMLMMVTAHFLYTNACQKGEECIVTTWDIQYEKFGWMLLYWNTAGVPFLYCSMGMYTSTINPHFQYPWYITLAMFALLFSAYYVFDTANGQKNRFRMERQGVAKESLTRKAFPFFSFGYIKNPKTIKSDRGELFVDGWYAYARKIHYTADTCMAFLWGFQSGSTAFIPYFYLIFFVSMLIHREGRDNERCKAKYGPLWKEYLKIVPYKFIPGVI